MSKHDHADRHAAFLLEVLEARITPANFFLSPTGSVTDSSGQDVNIPSLASEVGTSKAILLKKGDSLIFDANGDGVYDKKTETNLFQVKGGASYLFLDDVIEGDATPLDITGVAATTKFSAAAQTDILGDIATMTTVQGSGKSATYLFNKSIVSDATITGFTSSGVVTGSILAGGSISKINISGETDGYSVTDIRAGTGIGSSDINLGGATPIDVGLIVAAPGAKGASISGVTLAGGVHLIAAGEGGSVTDPASKLKPGAGGSISKITVSLGGDLRLIAGDGGIDASPQTDGVKSKFGGAGGAVSGVTISSDTDAYDIAITAGAAGYGGKSSGGSIEKLKILGDTLGGLSLATGNGSNAVEHAGNAGGNGGSLKSLSIAATSIGSLSVTTGVGGAGADLYFGGKLKGGGNGGNAGSLGNLDLSVEFGDLFLFLGSGGSAGGKFSGGNGTSIENLTFHLKEGADVVLLAGTGGDGWKAVGGGGSITNISLDSDGPLGVVTLTGGNGGSAYNLALTEKSPISQASGGTGGSVSNIITSVPLAGLNILAGTGGNAATVDYGADTPINLVASRATIGGAGGNISQITATLLGESNLFAGNAGASGNVATSASQFGAGVAGGSVTDLTFNGDNKADVVIVAGKGGKSASSGGAAGTVSVVSFKGTGLGFDSISLKSGDGADGLVGGGLTSSSTEGGAGGTFSEISTSGLLDAFAIIGGNGGNGAGITNELGFYEFTTAAGAGASIAPDEFKLDGDQRSFSIFGGSGGNGTNAGAGGTITGWTFDSSIDEVTLTGGSAGTGTVQAAASGSVTIINFTSGTFNKVTISGGNASDATFTGTAPGAGGDVLNIYSTLASTIGELTLTAGDGGDVVLGNNLNAQVMSTSPQKGGAGGAISDIRLYGAVGSLNASAGNGGDGQNTETIETGGAGGNAGSLSYITASNLQTLTLMAGNGGHGYWDKAGGNGGAISSVNTNISNSVQIASGSGGLGGNHGGAYGLSGAISSVTLASSASAESGGADVSVHAGTAGGLLNVTFTSGLFDTVSLKAGDGRDSILSPTGDTAGPAQGGGSISGITVAAASTIDTLELTAGNGGNGSILPGGSAGNGGNIGSLILNAAITEILLKTGNGGSGLNGGNGGTFGASGIQLQADQGTISLTTGNGGNGSVSGGNGGNISNPFLSSPGVEVLAAILTGGDGGNGTTGTGGQGGEITNVTSITAINGVEIHPGSDGTGAI